MPYLLRWLELYRASHTVQMLQGMKLPSHCIPQCLKYLFGHFSNNALTMRQEAKEMHVHCLTENLIVAEETGLEHTI